MSSRTEGGEGGNQVGLITATNTNQVTFDDVLLVVGEFGRYQKWLYFLFSVTYVVTAMQLLGWVFVGATPPILQCLPEKNSNSSLDLTNGSTICGDCHSGFVYDTSQIESSAVMEWDLVCTRSNIKATVSASPMVGYLVGGLIFGTLSDKIGRKPTFLISNMLLLLSGLCGALSPDYVTFVASRFVVGASIAGVESACFVMGMELVGPTKRTLAGILCWFFETTGLLMAVTLAYLVRHNWRLLQALYSLPGVIFCTYYCLAPESVRWLISRQRSTEAARLIKKTARINRVELPDGLLDKLFSGEEKQEESSTSTMLDLFRYPKLRIKTIILAVAWVVCSALYYVLLLDQSELSSDPYLGFLVTASVQLPGYVYVILTLERPRFGRKRSMCAFLVLSGVCLCLHPVIPEHNNGVKVGLSILGRFCANCSYTILNLFSAEQFPTVVRGVGVGFSLVVSRIGTVLAPYILLLGPQAPIVFGLAALLAGTLSLLLPETLGKKLPETLEDGETFGLAI